MRWYFLIILACAVGCTGNQGKEEFAYYRAVNKKDTAYLAINMAGKDFYGKYGLIKGWEVPVVGAIAGKVQSDTLTGTFIYTPYQYRNKKRVAFALLQREDQFISGSGTEIVYMGIPYYAPDALHFDDPEFTFERIEKPLIFE